MLQVYHGDGKGKTTAAMGLAIRSAGNGNKVIVLQFLKGSKTGEINILYQLPQVTVLRNELNLGFVKYMTQDNKQKMLQMHNDNLKKAIKQMEKESCQLLILDELLATYNLGLIDQTMIKELILNNKDKMEIVVTGRDPDDFFIAHADYITEMKKIRHPFDEGTSARKGVEY